jgi:glycosyltransferase involved in cell wall biosynthesis
MKRVDISVVVAAYNEEPVIIQSLQRIVSQLECHPETKWEVICVNDGSRDQTGFLLDEFARNDHRVQVLHHRRNFGQGRALRTAFNICHGDFIITLDADLSYGPRYIFELVNALEANNVEIALASPYMKGGMVRNVPFYRHMLSRWGNFYLARMSPYSISTSTSVVRAYRREVLDSLVLTSDGMELQLEILMKAYTLGFRVCEIPAQLQWGEDKKQNAKVRRVSKMRISGTIQTYLFLGWLTRPAVVFLILSWLLILPGLYMSIWLLWRVLERVPVYSGHGIIEAISLSLQYAFQTYTYSFIIYGGILLVGMQVFSYALLLLQNKYYFEEFFRLGYEIKKLNSALDREDKENE